MIKVPEIFPTDTPFTKKWKSYAIWDEKNIKGFFADYKWLSNFEPCTVWFEGMQYPSSEHAYMASKTLNTEIRAKFSSDYADVVLTASEAKKLGRTIELRENWDNIRGDMMLGIVFDKFWRNLELRRKLLDTGSKYLEETNHWKDLYYGVDFETGMGENTLGKILMKVREVLKY